MRHLLLLPLLLTSLAQDRGGASGREAQQAPEPEAPVLGDSFGPWTGRAAERRPVEVGPAFLGDTRSLTVQLTTSAKAYSNAPVAGVRIDVGLASAWDSKARSLREPHTLASVRTGEDGTARVELEVPGSWFEECRELRRREVAGEEDEDRAWARATEGAWVFAHVLEPGRKELLATRRIEEELEQGTELELRVKVRDGLTLRGALQLPGGERTAVPPWTPVRALDATSPRQIETGKVGPAGDFRLHFDEGAEVRVGAQVMGIGSACTEVLTLATDLRPDPVELVLSGAGTITGRLLRPDGTPVVYHPVVVEESRPPGARSRLGLLHHELRGDGLDRGSCITDATGAFHFAGLAPGDYDLAAYRSSRMDYDVVGRGLATGEEHRLVFRSRVLLVTVVDGDGSKVRPGVMDDGRSSIPRHDELSLYCRALDSSGRATRDSWSSTRAVRLPGGTVQFEVEADQDYAVGIVSEVHAHQEQTVRTGDVWQSEVELRLGEPVLPATVGLHVRAEGDEAIDDFRFQVHSERSGAVLLDGLSERDGSPPEFRLAPGAHELRVFVPTNHGEEGHVYGTARFVDAWQRLQLGPGDERKVEVVLQEGARLALRVDLPTGWAPEAALAKEPLTEDSDSDLVRRKAGGARVELVAEDGRLWLPRFQLNKRALPMVEGSNAAYHACWVRPGSEHTSFLALPAGHHRLRLEAPGCVPHEQDVVLRAGELTSVHVRFSAR